MARGKHKIKWTTEEEIHLIMNYKTTQNKILADKFNRSVESISGKYLRLIKECEKTGKYKDVFEEARNNEEKIEKQKQREKEKLEQRNRKKLEIEARKEQDRLKRIQQREEEKEKLQHEKEMKKCKEIYKKMINEPRDYGVALEIPKLKFKLGQNYVVRPTIEKGSLFKIFKGKLIEETSDFIVLKGLWTECFLKKDFLIGEYGIKEVKI